MKGQNRIHRKLDELAPLAVVGGVAARAVPAALGGLRGLVGTAARAGGSTTAKSSIGQVAKEKATDMATEKATDLAKEKAKERIRLALGGEDQDNGLADNVSYRTVNDIRNTLSEGVKRELRKIKSKTNPNKNYTKATYGELKSQAKGGKGVVGTEQDHEASDITQQSAADKLETMKADRGVVQRKIAPSVKSNDKRKSAVGESRDDDKRSTDISDLSHAAQHEPKKTTKKTTKKNRKKNTGVAYSQALQDQNPAEYR